MTDIPLWQVLLIEVFILAAIIGMTVTGGYRYGLRHDRKWLALAACGVGLYLLSAAWLLWSI